MKLREGNVFTPVCHSVPRGCLCQVDPPDRDPPGQRPMDRDPPGQRPPWTETPWIETPWTETPLDRDPQIMTPMVTSRRYTSYWNALLLKDILPRFIP